MCHARVVASFEQGLISRCTIMATTKSRSRQRCAEIRRSSSSLPIISSTAWTWAVRESLLCGEQFLRRDQALVAQDATEVFDFFFGPIGEIGQGALAGFLSLAPGLAEEHGRRGVAVGDDVDVHGCNKSHIIRHVKHKCKQLHGCILATNLGAMCRFRRAYPRIRPWNVGLEI